MLVTNAFKYAFPPSVTPGPALVQKSSEIRVVLQSNESTYTLIVSDNGVGLPPNIDIRTAKTLGLTLVRSWAPH